METQLRLNILPQPDQTTCGPTCLHAVYRYFGDPVSLEEVIAEVPTLQEGGTLAVLLACHALKRGYRATLYTYHLQVFDPTWFSKPGISLQEKLEAESRAKEDPKLQTAIAAYQEFLSLGGELRFEDLTAALIRRYLDQEIPILTGLSATYLYRCPRELGSEYDDVRGDSTGHFVVLCGYDRGLRNVMVADPLLPNPVSSTNLYEVRIERVICSILLGILTYDANLLVIRPSRESL